MTNTFIEIGREELLTLEQEQELAELIRQGDNSAATSLARANLRFVVALVRQYTDKGVSIEELIATSNKALEQAAMQFARKHRASPSSSMPCPLCVRRWSQPSHSKKQFVVDNLKFAIKPREVWVIAEK